ncbi:MAG: LLM class flavin-dependent oxidoreductase [Acidobacteria bacterium]|nr:LLM class flavin-dependent oxidoreductase [Acidobacteriota bacterium]
MGPLRFGLHSGQHRVSHAELRDLWRWAAGAGFDACYLFDHFRPLYSDAPGFLPEEADVPEGPCLEGFLTLAALAREVEEVSVGLMVAGVGYRTVALVGHMAATLQQAAAGRLEIGLGAGWFEPEHWAYGYDFMPARERLARLEGALEAVVAWWGGEAATVPALGLRELPVLPLRPVPRLWVAGTGERVILRLAARFADSWNAMFLTPDEFAGKVEALAGHCERIGRPMQRIERSIALRAFCSRDRTRALARLEGLAALRGRDAGRVRARSLVGTPAECADQVARYADSGATHITIMVHPPYDYEELSLLASEVLPRFR